MSQANRLTSLTLALVDVLLLLGLATMGASGYLMEQAHELHRRLLGLDGFEWREVHLSTFLLLVGLAVVHLTVNWRGLVGRWRAVLGRR